MSCLSECPNQLGDEFSNVTANTLEEVLIQGNITGNKDIVISAGQKLNASGAGSQVLARTAYVESIAPLTFPIGTQIGVLGGLTFPGDMNLRNNAQSGGTAVTIDSIPIAPTTQANVVSYDPTSKNLYYQSAGVTGVASVTGGTNISVTGTATDPIVNLQEPLTSALDVGNQIITSTTGDVVVSATTGNINLTATAGSVNVESVNVSGTTVSATSGGNNFSLSPTELLIAGGTQLTNTITANEISLLNFIPGIGGGVGRVDATASLGSAQLFLGCGVNSPGDQNTFRLTVAPSTGAIMEHETIAGTNRALTVRSEGSLNLQAGYNDTGATTAQPITITSTGQGGQANPTITLTNTNATGSVATEIYKNKPTAGANGDVLYTQAVYGKDSGNIKQEYTRITHTIRDATAGAEDGSLELGCFVNGVNTNFIALNGNDAPIGEVNISRPLDFIGGSDANATIKISGTGSVNLNIDSTNSVGTGAIALKTKNGVAGSGGGLLLTGNTLLSGSAGGNSGQHLCLTIGGVVYKIKLENP